MTEAAMLLQISTAMTPLTKVFEKTNIEMTD